MTINEKKPRSDKGTVRATERDLYCLEWMAEQYAVRGDHIQRLLSRFPDKDHPFKNGKIAPTTARDHIARWVRAGWINYERVLASGPGWAWVTKAGLEAVSLDYTPRPPSLKRLDHIYAVNEVRLRFDKKHGWISERKVRSQLEPSKKGKSTGPIIDGIVNHVERGRIAIEVQLSPLSKQEMEHKILHLLRAEEDGIAPRKRSYPLLWFYIPGQAVKTSIETACKALQKDDLQRVGIVVLPDIVMHVKAAASIH